MQVEITDETLRAFLDRHPVVLREFVQRESRRDPAWLRQFIQEETRKGHRLGLCVS